MTEPHRVLIAPSRLAGWLTRFDERHGVPHATLDDARLTLVAPDAAEAVIELIWGPLPGHDPRQELLAQVTRLPDYVPTKYFSQRSTVKALWALKAAVVRAAAPGTGSGDRPACR